MAAVPDAKCHFWDAHVSFMHMDLTLPIPRWLRLATSLNPPLFCQKILTNTCSGVPHLPNHV